MKRSKLILIYADTTNAIGEYQLTGVMPAIGRTVVEIELTDRQVAQLKKHTLESITLIET